MTDREPQMSDRRPIVLQNHGSVHPIVDDLLAPHVRLVTASASTAEALISEGTGAVAVIGRGPGKVCARVLEELADIRFAVAPGSGTDAIDVEAATGLGIAVVNNAGVAPQPVAEYVVGASVVLLKKLREADAALRAGVVWGERERGLRGREVSGRTMGLIGFGQIGREVARRARLGLGMQVLAHDPAVPGEVFAEHEVEPLPLPELLTRADVVSVHVPLLPGTRGLLGAEQLRLMRPGAVLVNTSRGGVVDEAALIECLRGGHLGGAALDVFDPEPPAPDNPLFGMDNVLVTPHLAGITEEAMERLGRACAANLLGLLRGVRPTRLVNDVTWPPPRAALLGWPLSPEV